MLHQVKPIARKSTPVNDLSYTELAVALHASGASARNLRSATRSELADLVAQGVSMVGIDQVRARARRTLAINRARAWHSPEHSELWQSLTVEQKCHDAAYRLTY